MKFNKLIRLRLFPKGGWKKTRVPFPLGRVRDGSIFLGFMLLFLTTAAQNYSSEKLTLMARWDDTTIAPNNAWLHSRYNSCFGWVANNGTEYAILGSHIGTHIISLADPSNPVQVDFVAGRRINCVWREYKTFNHYLYMVSDDGAPNSLQIADLSYLPDSVHLVYDSDSLFMQSHTIFIDGNKLYGGTVHTMTNAYSMAVYSLADPERPALLRTLNQDHSTIAVVHDMFVKDDIVYASCGFQGLHIYDFSSGAFIALDSMIAMSAFYNHSSCLSEDGNTLFFCHEAPPGQPIVAADVHELNHTAVINTFYSDQGCTPHNPYLKDKYLYVASYQDGLQVFDVSDPISVSRSGFFDTFPFNTTGYLPQTYQGAWGAYIDFPSGIILVSDMQSGLFILNDDELYPDGLLSPVVFPNPVTSKVNIRLPGSSGKVSGIDLMEVTGRIIHKESFSQQPADKTFRIGVENLPAGIYLLRVSSPEGEVIATAKFIKQN